MSRIEEVVDQKTAVEKPISDEKSGKEELNLCDICSDEAGKKHQKIGTARESQGESSDVLSTEKKHLPTMQIDGLSPEASGMPSVKKSNKVGGLKEGEEGFISRPDQLIKKVGLNHGNEGVVSHPDPVIKKGGLNDGNEGVVSHPDPVIKKGGLKDGEEGFVSRPDQVNKKGGLKKGEDGFISRPDQPSDKAEQADRAPTAPSSQRDVRGIGRELGVVPKEADGAQKGDVVKDGKPAAKPETTTTDTRDMQAPRELATAKKDVVQPDDKGDKPSPAGTAPTMRSGYYGGVLGIGQAPEQKPVKKSGGPNTFVKGDDDRDIFGSKEGRGWSGLSFDNKKK